MNVNKKELKEQEIRTLFITPALKESGWEVLKNMHRLSSIVNNFQCLCRR